MQLHLSDEDAAFREEMRTFFTTKVSEDIRAAVADRRVGAVGAARGTRRTAITPSMA